MGVCIDEKDSIAVWERRLREEEHGCTCLDGVQWVIREGFRNLRCPLAVYSLNIRGWKSQCHDIAWMLAC